MHSGDLHHLWDRNYTHVGGSSAISLYLVLYLLYHYWNRFLDGFYLGNSNELSQRAGTFG